MATETAEETKVTAEPKGADAFTAARAAVRASTTEPAPDDTPAKEPAQDPDKTTDEPTEVVEEPDTLTTEELAALPPKDRARAEKWQARLTQKAQALSAREKELDEWKTLNDGIRNKSKEALDVIAKHYGITVAEAKAVQDTPAEDLPEELKFLKPVFDAREKALEAKIRAELKPIKDAHAKIIDEAVASETDSTMKAFSAKYPGWEKREAQMLALGAKLLPGPEMTDFEYMETLYTLDQSRISEADKTKKVVAKINAAAKASEDKTSGISDERVTVKVPDNYAELDNKERMRLAFDAAKRGQVWDK